MTMVKKPGSRPQYFIFIRLILMSWAALCCSSASDKDSRPRVQSIQLYYNYSNSGENSVDVYIRGQNFQVDVFKNSSCDNKNAFVIDDNYKISIVADSSRAGDTSAPVQVQNPQWHGNGLLVATLPGRPAPGDYKLIVEDPFGTTTQLNFIIMGPELPGGEDSDTMDETDSDTPGFDTESDSDSETDTGTSTEDSDSEPPETESADTNSDLDTETGDDTETESDTGRPMLTPCEQAKVTNPDIVCCPSPAPQNCLLDWPEELDKYSGCCTQDLQQAIRCLNVFFYTPAECFLGACKAPKGLFDFHYCSANYCNIPQTIASLPANAPIHWSQYQDTFRPSPGDGCVAGTRDMWFLVPIPLIGKLEVSLLSGDDVYIQEVSSCTSISCNRVAESPNHLLVNRTGVEQTAIILISQVDSDPEGASVIRFQPRLM